MDGTVGWRIRETSDEAGSDRISQGIKPLKMCSVSKRQQSCPAAHFRLDLIVETRISYLFIEQKTLDRSLGHANIGIPVPFAFLIFRPTEQKYDDIVSCPFFMPYCVALSLLQHARKQKEKKKGKHMRYT